MSNVLVTSSLVAKEALAVLKNMLSFAAAVNRDYEDEYASNMSRGYAPGATINIKRPPRYTYRAGRVAAPQTTVETTIPLTVSQGGCDIFFNSFERTLSLTQFEKKVRAAMAPVANEIDRQGLQLAHFATYNTLNPTGALPTTQALAINALTSINQRLDEMAAPVKDGNRYLVMNPALNGAMIQGFAGLFNMAERISGQYRTGYMQDSFGIHPNMDQNVDVHTNGAGTASNINGANQVGSAITVAATGAGTITRGTTITLPGVFAVNPQSRTSTGALANFVITADVAQGAVSLPISPAIVTSGPFQNVTASPTTAQPFVILGAASTAYSTNIGFHQDAFTLAMVPLFEPPATGVMSVKQVSDEGFRLRVLEYFDGAQDIANMRIDILFGWAATYAELSAKYYTIP
jgi:hypothetical protein